MITQNKPWKFVLGDRDDYIKAFDKINLNYFDSEDDLIAHAVITIKKLYIVRKDIDLAWAVFIEAVAGMRFQLGYNFSYNLASTIRNNPDLIPLSENICSYNEAYEKSVGRENDLNMDLEVEENIISPLLRKRYYVDEEYAIISLNLKQKETLAEKIRYLFELSEFYNSLIGDDPNNSFIVDDPDNYKNFEFEEHSFFITFYSLVLLGFGDQIMHVKASKNEIKHISFIDDSIRKQIYYTLIHARNHPKDKPRLIQKRDQVRFSRFLEYGSTKNGTKVFFRGDAITLSYCFYELYKNNLINKVEKPDGDLTLKEIATIIYNNFDVGGGFTEKSIHDYLRKGEKSRPLNPIFIIKKNDAGERPFDYLLYKPKFRKRGQPYNPNDLQPYDTKIIEQILGLDQ
ncbi:MAG: hypothetical protein DRJ10_00935 [Bacteroidetes bacterium]|nr:MAG: hypothetical protein DRJ10_00935 [Bacteroidota bacterium]